jgi:FAD dependent monooxygenase
MLTYFLLLAIYCEYSCLFGISDKVQGMNIGHANITHRTRNSFLSAVGKGGTVYWFFFEKLPGIYRPPNIPRFSEQDAIEAGEKAADYFHTEEVTFGDLWKNRMHAAKVSMEEGVHKRWHYGRSVIIGDAAHKVGKKPDIKYML